MTRVFWNGWCSGCIVSFRRFHFLFNGMRWLLRSNRTSQCWVHHRESAAMLMQHKGLRLQNLGLSQSHDAGVSPPIIICLALWVRDARIPPLWSYLLSSLYPFTSRKQVADVTSATLLSHWLNGALEERCGITQSERTYSAAGDFEVIQGLQSLQGSQFTP